MKWKLALGVAALCATSPVSADVPLKVNGYFNTAFARSNSDTKYLTYITNDGTFSADTSFGLQVMASVNADVTFTLQLVADHDSANVTKHMEPRVDWAYVTYQTNDELKVRAGRLRLPAFLYSDNINVRYAQPWVRPPTDVYGIFRDLPNFNGMDALYTTRFGAVDVTLQPFTGTTTWTVMGNTSTLKNNLGLVVTANVGDLTLRAMRWDNKFDIPAFGPLPALLDKKGRYEEVGVLYDRDFFFVAEKTWTQLVDLNPGQTSYYGTLGYHFGKFLPHVTYSRAHEGPTLPNAQKTRTVGLRYDVAKGTALKAEVSQIDPGTVIPGLGGFEAQPAENRVNVYSIGLNVVF